MKKKTKAGDITILDLQLYYKAVVIRTVLYLHKKTHRSIEQNRKPRNGTTTIWSTNLRQSRKEYPVEERQQIVLGKLDSDMQKNEPGPLSYTIYKNKFKMDEGPKCEKGNHQNPRGEHR